MTMGGAWAGGERLKAGSSPHSLALFPPSELLYLVGFIHSCLSVPIILGICCVSDGQHACFVPDVRVFDSLCGPVSLSPLTPKCQTLQPSSLLRRERQVLRPEPWFSWFHASSQYSPARLCNLPPQPSLRGESIESRRRGFHRVARAGVYL